VEHQHRVVGRRLGRSFRIGDPLRVRIASVSIERKQIDLVLAGDDRPAARPRGR
jgi:ribonuclease R